MGFDLTSSDSQYYEICRVASLLLNQSEVTVNFHSDTLTAAADWCGQDHGRSGAGSGTYFDLTAKLLRTPTHAFQSMAVIYIRLVESMSIVAQLQENRSTLDLQRSS